MIYDICVKPQPDLTIIIYLAIHTSNTGHGSHMHHESYLDMQNDVIRGA